MELIDLNRLVQKVGDQGYQPQKSDPGHRHQVPPDQGKPVNETRRQGEYHCPRQKRQPEQDLPGTEPPLGKIPQNPEDQNNQKAADNELALEVHSPLVGPPEVCCLKTVRLKLLRRPPELCRLGRFRSGVRNPAVAIVASIFLPISEYCIGTGSVFFSVFLSPRRVARRRPQSAFHFTITTPFATRTAIHRGAV